MHADAACVLAQAADADPLRNYAAEVVAYQNRERTEDVLRIAAFALGVPLERLEGAQLLWLDRLGIYLFAATVGGPGRPGEAPSHHAISYHVWLWGRQTAVAPFDWAVSSFAAIVWFAGAGRVF